MLVSASASAAFPMPMATAALPKLCARSITVLQSGALILSVPQSLTKVRSSLSSAKGSSLSRANEE
jgi:glycerate-2-kinase